MSDFFTSGSGSDFSTKHFRIDLCRTDGAAPLDPVVVECPDPTDGEVHRPSCDPSGGCHVADVPVHYHVDRRGLVHFVSEDGSDPARQDLEHRASNESVTGAVFVHSIFAGPSILTRVSAKDVRIVLHSRSDAHRIDVPTTK